MLSTIMNILGHARRARSIREETLSRDEIISSAAATEPPIEKAATNNAGQSREPILPDRDRAIKFIEMNQRVTSPDARSGNSRAPNPGY